MKILIAPDKFKGSLSAIEVCKAIERGIKKFDPEIETILKPLADGGEGTLDILAASLDFETMHLEVNDPLFRPIEAFYKMHHQTAYIEMANASGLQLLSTEERNCLHTTTLGTGELILDAIKKDANQIYLFIGGSATNDAGIGMAQALGYRFFDIKNKLLLPVGKNLIHLQNIDNSNLKADLSKVKFHVVCDVKNVLYGKNGAAPVYAPQKGADEAAVKLLDEGLKHFSKVVEKDLGKSVANKEGSGAAGGLGAGAIAFLNADILPGIQTIIEITKFKDHLLDIDLLITGEGKLDEQTAQGKVISGLAQMVKTHEIPLAVICGSLDASEEAIRQLGIYKVLAVKTNGVSLQQAMTEASIRIENIAFELVRDFQKG